MPNLDAETTCKEAVLQGIALTVARKMAQPLIRRVDMLTETNRVQARVKPTGRARYHVTGWHVVRFDQPGVAVAALYLEAVEVGGRDRTDEMLHGEVRGLSSYEIPLRLLSLDKTSTGENPKL
jgi:hypothetical protein